MSGSKAPHMASLSSEASVVVDSTASGASNLSSSASSTSSIDLVSSSYSLSVVGVPVASIELTMVESIVVVACSLETVDAGSSSTDRDSDNDRGVFSGKSSAEDRLEAGGSRSGTVSGTFTVIDWKFRSRIVVVSYALVVVVRSIVFVRFLAKALPVLRGPGAPAFEPPPSLSL